jgi:hypothetical protein
MLPVCYQLQPTPHDATRRRVTSESHNLLKLNVLMFLGVTSVYVGVSS